MFIFIQTDVEYYCKNIVLNQTERAFMFFELAMCNFPKFFNNYFQLSPIIIFSSPFPLIPYFLPFSLPFLLPLFHPSISSLPFAVNALEPSRHDCFTITLSSGRCCIELHTRNNSKMTDPMALKITRNIKVSSRVFSRTTCYRL